MNPILPADAIAFWNRVGGSIERGNDLAVRYRSRTIEAEFVDVLPDRHGQKGVHDQPS